MFCKTRLLVVLITGLLASCFPSFAQAQVVNIKFVSIDGGFAIDLPSNVDEGVRPVGSLSSGAATFSWRISEGNFTVGFVDGVRSSGDGYLALNVLADAVARSRGRADAKVVDRAEFTFYGNPGIELKLMRNAMRSINRFILVKDRLYILTVDFPANRTETAIEGILDSFELIDGRALIG